MYCSKCGQENPAESTLCGKCGQPLTAPGTVPKPAPAGAARTDGKAVASLVLGLMSWILCLSIFTGIPAIILGHISQSNIKKSMGRLKGEGMALAGLIMGYLSVVGIPVILIIAAIAIPNLLRARISANESSAVGSIRTINTAEVTYASTYPQAGFSASLEALGGSSPCTSTSTTACLIEPVLAAGQKSGYRFTYEAQDTNGDQVMDTYVVQAVPVSPGQTGVRFFCSDESGIIRYSTAEPCTRESQPLQ